MGFNLDDYEPVATRLARWLEANPDGQVMTEMLSEPGADICVFKTTLLIGGVPIATGHAEEVRGQGNVNRTSHVENCETSSTGRALGNAGYAGSDPMKRPSREEMSKVVRMGGDQPNGGGGDKASPAQMGKIRALSKALGKPAPTGLDALGKREASGLIETLIQETQSRDAVEDPF